MTGVQTCALPISIELLKSAQAGEQEPRTRWFLTLLGLVCLGSGYAIAILCKDPIAAILLFFLAALLVILGTYCLFTAGSVALLKALRRNKRYYYQPRTSPPFPACCTA